VMRLARFSAVMCTRSVKLSPISVFHYPCRSMVAFLAQIRRIAPRQEMHTPPPVVGCMGGGLASDALDEVVALAIPHK